MKKEERRSFCKDFFMFFTDFIFFLSLNFVCLSSFSLSSFPLDALFALRLLGQRRQQQQERRRRP